MLRRALYWPAALLWSGIILPLVVLTGALTLGRMGGRVTELWAGLWGRGMLRVGGVELVVIGREHLEPRRSRILVMNHSSFLDMQAAAALNPPAVIALAKREFFFIPLLGQAIWASGQVFVDRGNPRQARRSVERLAEAMRASTRTAIIFPEGTRSRSGVLLPFKMGAFRLALQTRAPILPVVLHGAYALQTPDEWIPRPGRLVLEIFPEIQTEAWTEGELHARAEALRDWYEARLRAGPPVTSA